MPGPNNIAKTWLIYNHKEKEIRNIILKWILMRCEWKSFDSQFFCQAI